MRFQNRVCLLTSHTPKKKGKKGNAKRTCGPPWTLTRTSSEPLRVFGRGKARRMRHRRVDVPVQKDGEGGQRIKKKKKLTRPGIEPGSAPWQGAILPLDQRVLRSGLSVNSEAPTSRSYPISKTGAMSNHPFPSGLFDVYESESSNYVPCFFPEYTGYYSTIGHGP